VNAAVYKQLLEHSNIPLCFSEFSQCSCNLFLNVFQECGPLLERGMVMGVLDHAFDVIVLKLGVVKRVYVEVIQMFNSFDQSQLW
jgi:DIS3-like exonuclease 2 C terminal